MCGFFCLWLLLPCHISKQHILKWKKKLNVRVHTCILFLFFPLHSMFTAWKPQDCILDVSVFYGPIQDSFFCVWSTRSLQSLSRLLSRSPCGWRCQAIPSNWRCEGRARGRSRPQVAAPHVGWRMETKCERMSCRAQCYTDKLGD